MACHEFQTTLGCRVRLCLKESKRKRPEAVCEDTDSSLLGTCGAEVGSLTASFNEVTCPQASHPWVPPVNSNPESAGRHLHTSHLEASSHPRKDMAACHIFLPLVFPGQWSKSRLSDPAECNCLGTRPPVVSCLGLGASRVTRWEEGALPFME